MNNKYLTVNPTPSRDIRMLLLLSTYVCMHVWMCIYDFLTNSIDSSDLYLRFFHKMKGTAEFIVYKTTLSVNLAFLRIPFYHVMTPLVDAWVALDRDFLKRLHRVACINRPVSFHVMGKPFWWLKRLLGILIGDIYGVVFNWWFLSLNLPINWSDLRLRYISLFNK